MKYFQILYIVFNLSVNNALNIGPIKFDPFSYSDISTTKINKIKTIDPLNQNSKRSVVFFPAKTINQVPSDLYNNFLHSIANNDIRVYIPNYDDVSSLLETLDLPQTTIVAHSTSSIKALSLCQENENIKNLVLIDPIDVQQLENKKISDNNIIKLPNIDKLLVFNSKKSSDWKLLPLILPINMFSLKSNTINLTDIAKREVIDSDDFGHFDIFDSQWSDLMNNIISKGSEDRNPLKLQNYHKQIADKISELTINSE